MGIQAVARGLVVGTPERVTVERGSVTSFLIRDLKGRGDRVEYQVLCRDSRLAECVRANVNVGDSVVILGTLTVRRAMGPIEDDISAAMVSLEAHTVARVLDLP